MSDAGDDFGDFEATALAAPEEALFIAKVRSIFS